MISRELFERYAKAIDANADLLQAAVAQLEAKLSGIPPSEAESALTTAYMALVARYGSFAAAIAVDFYARQREASGVASAFVPEVSGAAPAWSLRWDVSDAYTGSDLARAVEKLGGRSVQRVMEQADETLLQNARRDPARPKWALVPHSGVCGWCAMLASNGFVYASESTANKSRHPNCRCRPVVDFDDDPLLEGYDHGRYEREYFKARKAIEDDVRKEWAAMSDEERDQWKVKGKGAYDHYMRNRITAQMDTRRAGK